MRQKKPKLKWVEIYWAQHWHYQDEDGAVFGGVVKTGGAMSHPYRPLRFLWYVGDNPNEPGQLKGEFSRRSEAQRQLEELYVRYVEIHAKQAESTETEAEQLETKLEQLETKV